MGLDDQVYIELDKETGGIKRVLTVGGKEEAAIRWSGPGIGGAGSINSFPDSVCKSFKKRVTKFNALDQSEGAVVHEHWCALFEESCPVIGATAKAPECLRNQKNRTVRDPRDNTLTRTHEDYLAQGPGNTFVSTNLPRATLTTSAGADSGTLASLQERRDQISRIRADAVNLRSSLRSYVAAEKKTLK